MIPCESLGYVKYTINYYKICYMHKANDKSNEYRNGLNLLA